MIQAHLLPAFSELPIEAVTTEVIERWLAGFGGSPRTRNKVLIQLHGILGRAKKVYGLQENAAADMEEVSRRPSGEIEVFSPEEVWAGRLPRWLGAAPALQAALAAAGLRPLRFHDLRYTFGTRMIAKADIRRVQEWMGHADIQTTMRHLHDAPREEDARLVAERLPCATL